MSVHLLKDRIIFSGYVFIPPRDLRSWNLGFLIPLPSIKCIHISSSCRSIRFLLLFITLSKNPFHVSFSTSQISICHCIRFWYWYLLQGEIDFHIGPEVHLRHRQRCPAALQDERVGSKFKEVSKGMYSPVADQFTRRAFHKAFFQWQMTEISDNSVDNQSVARISVAYKKTVIYHWWQVLWNAPPPPGVYKNGIRVTCSHPWAYISSNQDHEDVSDGKEFKKKENKTETSSYFVLPLELLFSDRRKYFMYPVYSMYIPPEMEAIAENVKMFILLWGNKE